MNRLSTPLERLDGGAPLCAGIAKGEQCGADDLPATVRFRIAAASP